MVYMDFPGGGGEREVKRGGAFGMGGGEGQIQKVY